MNAGKIRVLRKTVMKQEGPPNNSHQPPASGLRLAVGSNGYWNEQKFMSFLWPFLLDLDPARRWVGIAVLLEGLEERVK